MSWLRILGIGAAKPGGTGAKGDPLAALAPWRERHRRTAWKPKAEDGDGPPRASKFCGIPWLAAGEPWPACADCGRPMPLFLQLDLAAASRDTGEALGDGLLQLFYCVAEGCHADGWEPFGKGKLVRVIPASGPAAAATPPPDLRAMPPKRIVGWEPLEDLPDMEEQELLGLTHEWKRSGSELVVRWPEASVEVVTADVEFEKAVSAAPGDKLLGWPSWVQGVEYPGCPRCGTRMELLFQVDSEDHVPFMFGDVGCGHVTRCPRHPDVVAFGWACS
jgi:hypothetical protein